MRHLHSLVCTKSSQCGYAYAYSAHSLNQPRFKRSTTPARGQEHPGLRDRELPRRLLHRWALGQQLTRQAPGKCARHA